MKFFTFLKQLAPFFSPYKWQVLFITLLILVPVTFAMAVPLSLKWIFDEAITNNDSTLMWTMLGWLGVGLLFTGLANLTRAWLSALFSSAVIRDIRRRLFTHMHSLSFDYFRRTPSGDLISHYTNDLLAVERIAINVLFDSIFFVALFLLSATMLFILEWRLALATFLSLPMFLVVMKTLGPRASLNNDQKKEREGEVVSELQENLRGYRVIRALSLDALSLKKFDAKLDKLRESSIRANFLAQTVEKSILLLVGAIQILIIGMGGLLVINGDLTSGALIAFVGLLVNVVESVSALTKTIPDIFQAMSGLERIHSLLHEKPEQRQLPNAQNAQPFSQDIRFDKVEFSYTGESKHLNQMSFTIPKGSSAAFVGASGAGKSTIVNLLLGFHHQDEGGILFDGMPMESLNRDSVLAQFGVVFQDSILFNSSIRENILLGFPDADDQQLQEAARKAEIHDFIESLPDSYDTLVGESGDNLSGGQRQRLSLARALIRNPEVLILDEATSSLDQLTEDAINQTLKRLAQELTLITITHRLGPVADYDHIFVLEKGALAEHGNHQQLINHRGIYHQLWNKQHLFTINSESNLVEVEAKQLQAIQILKELDKTHLDQIAKYFVTETLQAGQIVFREGDEGTKFFVIVRGSVEVIKQIDTPEEKLLAVIQDGEYFGEIALIRSTPRIATVRTRSVCTLLSLTRNQFFHIVKESDEWQTILNKAAQERLAAVTTTKN
ncbi:MAG: ATP-binding cassette domain-containing protein [Gammaproteobacteria bacterium]|nr:ATP-binding cassette domain-containing protein [Gammaproteobacteria bacterium]